MENGFLMQNGLIKAVNIKQHDDVYEMIINLHKDLNKQQSETANQKLILVLANHIGDISILREAVALVKDNALTWSN